MIGVKTTDRECAVCGVTNYIAYKANLNRCKECHKLKCKSKYKPVENSYGPRSKPTIRRCAVELMPSEITDEIKARRESGENVTRISREMNITRIKLVTYFKKLRMGHIN